MAIVVRWNIFTGIMFSVIGMCLLNYYSLFPRAVDKFKVEEESLVCFANKEIQFKMNRQVCCFNDRLIYICEAPRNFKFTSPSVNRVTLRQTFNIYPNFIHKIAGPLEQLCQQYKVIAILYNTETLMMNSFPNGSQQTINYYVYYTTLDDCLIDNVFYDELLGHLTDKMGLSNYVAHAFLYSLRAGFNKPNLRINELINKYNISTQPDDIDDIRRMVLKLRPDQAERIMTQVSKSSTFDSILPNMLLLNVTNCTQQESLSIKHSSSTSSSTASPSATSSSSANATGNSSENDLMDDDSEMASSSPPPPLNVSSTSSVNGGDNEQTKFKMYIKGKTEFQQHIYYCSYGPVVAVLITMQMATFQNLIAKNLITAFFIKSSPGVDELDLCLFIDQRHFEHFAKVRVNSKILQFKVMMTNVEIEPHRINYNIDYNVPLLYSTAPLLLAHTKGLKDSFKAKTKIIQLYLIVCPTKLHHILSTWSSCICRVLRNITSPYMENGHNRSFIHTLFYIHEEDVDFLYEFLPNIGMDNTPCSCTPANMMTVDIRGPKIKKRSHSQKLWYNRPCIEILFHTHFDWTILKIHDDFLEKKRRQTTDTDIDIFKLYDVFEQGKMRIAHLLDTKVFKVTIENLTTFKFYHETGLLYPFNASGHEELYIYTLIKMTRIVYRCLVVPLMKLEKMSPKNLLPSKFLLTYAFIDDPLTPTTSVRGPQSTRNLKSVESSERLFDTKVINVTMLMNSFNLCGSESNENAIKI